MLVFTLLVLVVFNFAYEFRRDIVGTIAPGTLWMVFLFAGLLGLARAFAIERDKGTLDGLRLCPVGREGIYLGKLLGNLAFIVAVEAVAVPLFGALFSFPIPWSAVPILLLGTLGFAAVGTLFSAIAAHTRAREVMLPLLLLPLSVPVIVASVRATQVVLEGSAVWDTPWPALLSAYDVIFLAVAFLLFETVLDG
jgi:heme exporter protein B